MYEVFHLFVFDSNLYTLEKKEEIHSGITENTEKPTFDFRVD